MKNLKKFNNFLNEELVGLGSNSSGKKDLTDLEVGDEVMCGGSSGFCRTGKQTIKKITKKYDENTGEPYNVIWIEGDRKFDARNGAPLTPPWAYHIWRNLEDHWGF